MLSQRARAFPNVLFEALVRQAEALLRDSHVGNSIVMQDELSVNETWFWREPWLTMEREVDAYVQRGDVQAFDDMDEFFASLGD